MKMESAWREWRVWLVVIFVLFPAPSDSPPVPQSSSWCGWDQELQCEAEESAEAELLVLEWNKEGVARHVFLYRDDTARENDQDPAFRRRVRLRDPQLRSGDLSIVLKNVSSEDSGVYSCQALVQRKGDRRQKVSQSVHLTVTPVKSVVAHSGEDRTLPCASPPGGAQVLALRWSRRRSDGRVLRCREERLHQNQTFTDPPLGSGDLLLKNVSSEDGGVYRCHIHLQNPDGTQQEQIHFTQLTVMPVEQIVARSGEDRALPCASPPGGAPVLFLQWSRRRSDGHVLRYTNGSVEKQAALSDRVALRDPQLRSGDAALVLKNVSSRDSGVYRCLLQIQTADGPQELTHAVNLTVTPGAAPPAHVIWGSLVMIVVVGVVVFICVWESKKARDDGGRRRRLFQRAETHEEEPEGKCRKSRALPRPQLGSLDRKGSAGDALLETPGFFTL